MSDFQSGKGYLCDWCNQSKLCLLLKISSKYVNISPHLMCGNWANIQQEYIQLHLSDLLYLDDFFRAFCTQSYGSPL